jgi:methionyl-tRNA synthetase
VLLHPVLPRATRELWSRLGADRALGALAEQRIATVATWGQLPAGTPVRKGDPLFPRVAR